MNTLTLIKIQSDNVGELRVSSRIVADQCDIQHHNVLGLLFEYQEPMEKEFGVCLFETEKPLPGTVGGRPSKTAFLTEPQATFLVTLMRNTEPVVRFKASLTKAFFDARKALTEAPRRATLADTIDRTSVLEVLQGHPMLRGAKGVDLVMFGRLLREIGLSSGIKPVVRQDAVLGRVKEWPVKVLDFVATQIGERDVAARRTALDEENPLLRRDMTRLMSHLAMQGDGTYSTAQMQQMAEELNLFPQPGNRQPHTRRMALGRIFTKFCGERFECEDGRRAKLARTRTNSHRLYIFTLLD